MKNIIKNNPFTILTVMIILIPVSIFLYSPIYNFFNPKIVIDKFIDEDALHSYTDMFYDYHSYISDDCYLVYKRDTTNRDTINGIYQYTEEAIECDCEEYDKWEIGDEINFFKQFKIQL